MSIQPFTPPSLAQLPEPPVFSLRAAESREYRTYQHALRAEGLHFPSDEEVRSEVRRAVGKLYTPEQAEAALVRLEAFWAAADKGGPPAPGEAAAVKDLTERLSEAWPRLARLGGARVRFEREASSLAVSMFVVDWSGLDLPYQRVAGCVPLELVDELEEALLTMEAQSSGGTGAPGRGLAFTELCNAAFARLDTARPGRARPAIHAVDQDDLGGGADQKHPQRRKPKAPSAQAPAASNEKDS